MTVSITAKRLPKFHGPAAWDAILPARAPYAPLDGAATVDFAIIGAGFAGLSAARRLTQVAPGARVAVLDALRVGQGGAGRNSGFMIDLPHDLTSDDYAGASAARDREIIALNRRAIGFAQAAAEEYGIQAGFLQVQGKINGAAGARAHAQNLSYAAHLTALGEAHEMLDAQAMREATGSSHYRSGLFTPGTAMLQPAGYARGLAAGLHAQGVAVHEETPVLAMARAGSGWALKTPGGRLGAGAVILANNGHLESFGFEAGRLMHVFLFAAMTEELDAAALRALGGRPNWGVTPSDPMGATMRRISAPQGGERIVTRTVARFEPGMQTRPSALARARRVMREKFEARFPQLKSVKTAHVWEGHLCLSLNHVSVARELDRGLYAACVQNGLGAARGTLTGIAAAELAAGAPGEIARAFAGAARPSRLPPAPLARIGANAFLSWKEWRARQE